MKSRHKLSATLAAAILIGAIWFDSALAAADSYAAYDREHNHHCSPTVADDTPVYDATSGRYFECVYVTTTKYSSRRNNDVSWETANKLAQGRAWKGVRGGLAIVDSPEIHEFLLMTFQPTLEMWIGLRYWCSVSKLQFTDGRFLGREMFQPWDKEWDRSHSTGCEEYKSYKTPQFMGVFYLPVQQGFRWVAHNWHKQWYCFLVEYRTGKP